MPKFTSRPVQLKIRRRRALQAIDSIGAECASQPFGKARRPLMRAARTNDVGAMRVLLEWGEPIRGTRFRTARPC